MPILKCTVEESIKESFVLASKKQGLSEAQLLRSLILIHLNVEDESSKILEPVVSEEYHRVTFRLPAFIKKRVMHKARSKGMDANTWIASLIQTCLLKEPVMSHNELAALHASQRELTAIGRNINQIARSLNERPGDESAVRQNDLRALTESLVGMRRSIRRMVRVSLQSWGEIDE